MKRYNGLGETISVCLLTYNHVDVIESTLRSILDQTITGYEVIVSDDCSTDGTWERILEIAAGDGRITAIRTPHNTGMPGNANYAVAHSHRPYVALLHHDDLYRRDLLEKWVGVIQRNPNVAFVFNPYEYFSSNLIYSDPMPGENIEGEWLLTEHLFCLQTCVVRGTTMIRRDAWNQVGGMREQFGLLADIDLWMRLSMRWNVGYVPERIIVVRQQRPSYYPSIYQNGSWSWLRLRYLYEIHAANWREYLNLQSAYGRIRWWEFRLRLSLETTKWIGYAIVRRKHEMLASSGECETPYDLLPLRLFRGILLMSLGVISRVQRGLSGTPSQRCGS